MALLDEELVGQWLNQQGFFTMRGLKAGLGEMDFLAIRPLENNLECWHVEVTISFRPIGYIGGGKSAKRRSEEELQVGVDDWVRKKFTDSKKVERREQVLAGQDWKFVLVCGAVRHQAELEAFEERGIAIYRYQDVLEALVTADKNLVGSDANQIIEILRYFRS